MKTLVLDKVARLGLKCLKKRSQFFQAAENRIVRALSRGAVLWMMGLLCLAPGMSWAQMLESFEYGVPPPGWIKTNLQGGSGWYQLPRGIAPLPGWGNGTSSVPATANAGTHNAYCTWSTGGSAAQGYHSDQWLISPQMNGLTATSSLSYWLRFGFTNYPDEVRVRISTTGPAPANFTRVVYTNIWSKGGNPGQFGPWTRYTVNLGALGIAPGTPIWVAVQEYVWDNTWNGAAVELDVITSDLTVAPQPRVNPTSLTFTAYYEGSDPASQTFSVQSIGSSGMSFSRYAFFGAGPTNWLTVGGPSAGTLAFQNSQTFTASVSVAGLDLGTYCATNIITVPGATSSPLRIPITFNVIRRPQTISFPNPGPQWTTNRVGLAGTSSSGLPVTFSIYSGPGLVTGATNLTFTGAGTVRVLGWQLGNVYYDVAPCATNSIAVSKPDAVIAFANLSHVHDGSPHGPTITTIPEGLTLVTTYNGNPALPVAIGSYAVTSTVNDLMYGGSAVSTFTITRMLQTITFPDPGPQWTTSHVGLAATASSGLPVTFSVASGPGTVSGGTNLTFLGAGPVSIVAAQAGDADWQPAAETNTIMVSKTATSVELNDLEQIYSGAPLIVTATTVPPGLAVDITYDGSVSAPVDCGIYTVTGVINDAIYSGTAVAALTVSQAGQTITFPALQPCLTNAAVVLGAIAALPVTEFAVISGPGVINGTNLTFTGAGDVLIAAAQAGDANWNPAAAVTNLVKCFAVNPLSGPAAGGNEVLITSGHLENITNVTLCGVQAAILDQGTNWVSVQCGAGAPGKGDLLIQSDSDLVVSNAYTYNPTGTIFSVEPEVGSYIGGYPVTITGTNLCSGDVTGVTLCGVPAVVTSQSATQIVVTAGAGPMGPGDVRVDSVSFGQTVRTNAFTYAIPEMNLLSAGGEQIASGASAALSRGTDFGDLLVFDVSTNWFEITNSAAASLFISGITTSGTDAASFWVQGMPASVPPGGSAGFSIVFAPMAAGVHRAAIWLANDSTTTPYQIILAGASLKRDQYDLTFTPVTPQIYNTTSGLAAAGGQSSGGWTYTVESGLAEIVGETNLWMRTGTGSATVRATRAGDANWNEAYAEATVNAAKASQTIDFPNPGPQVATNIVDLSADSSSGLPVIFSVESGPAVFTGTNLNQVAFTNLGTVVLGASQAGDANWNPAATSVTFAVDRDRADIVFTNLSHVYDGTAKTATVSTIPAGLNVVVSYPPLMTPPVNAGTSLVVAVINEALYRGSDTNWVVIARAAQEIEFAAIGDQAFTNTPGLAGTAASGLPVSFGVTGPASLSGGTNLSFTGTGMVGIVASQAGNTNWLAAPGVTNSFMVYPLAPLVSGPFHLDAAVTGALMGATIDNVFGADATERGLVWSTSQDFDPAAGSRSAESGSFGAGTWTQQVGGLSAGLTNFYMAYAVNAAGTGCTARGWVLMRPAAPVADNASNHSFDSFQANWQPSTGAWTYWIDVSGDAGFASFIPGYENRDAGNATSISVTGLSAGATCYYRIRAENDAGLSEWSNVKSAAANPSLTLVCLPKSGGTTIPAPGCQLVDFAAPVSIQALANAGYAFARWDQTGGGNVADPSSATTVVTLTANSIVTAVFAQQAGDVSAGFDEWRTNWMTGTMFADIMVCNNYTNGARMAGPVHYCVQSNINYRLMHPDGTDGLAGWPYVDITAQVAAGTGDGILDPGECVLVTNIEFYIRTLQAPASVNWKITALLLPPANALDTDGDGMPDTWEQRYAPPLDHLHAPDGQLDSDGDTFCNLNEFIAGTDPTDVDSYLQVAEIMRAPAAGAVIEWPAVTGRYYRVNGTTNLFCPFVLLQSGIPSTPPVNVFTDTVFGVQNSVIYRIEAGLEP